MNVQTASFCKYLASCMLRAITGYAHFHGESGSAGWTWLLVLAVCAYLVGFTLGFGCLPWFMPAELIPKEAQSWANSCIVVFSFSLSFLVLKTFIMAVDVLGSAIIFGVFSIFCCIGIVFVYFCVPETKNRSFDEIQRSIEFGIC